MLKKILLISYWVNKKGNSPSIMADDKIDSLLKIGASIIVISSFDSNKILKNNVLHVRVPSLSCGDYFDQIKNVVTIFDKFIFLFFFPFVITLGLVSDYVEKIILKGKGGGYWLWFAFTSPIAIFINLVFKPDLYFSTGGPASSHLVGIIISFFSKSKYYAELQDPLVGKDIGRFNTSKKFLKFFEIILLKRCYKLIFVTKKAADEAKIRNKKFSYKIKGIYSGSVNKNINLDFNNSSKKIITKFIHLGTLYSSRNLNNFIRSLKYLSNQSKISLSKIKVINLGDIYGEAQIDHTKLHYVEWHKSINRKEALKKSLNSDFLLLIQHIDERSNLTFPYKVYEYLNLQKPIFALINNNELKRLLEKKGHICANVNNIKDIVYKLHFLITNKEKIINNVRNLKFNSRIDPVAQCKKLFEL